MAKSKAQRMKEYRERKKQEMGEDWLKKERERVKKYYIPLELLPAKDRKRKQAINRNNWQNFRNKRQKPNDSSTPQPSSSSENEVTSTTGYLQLPSLMDSIDKSRKSSGRKRVNRALSRAHGKIKRLQKTSAKNRKIISRLRKKVNDLKPANTPRSKTDKLLKKSGFSPSKVPRTIRKKLIFSECVSDELKQSNQKKPISGRILKKYKLANQLRNSGYTWRKLREKKARKIGNQKKYDEIRSDVIEFFERDDNSRMMP
ncbi:unnamed protein product, partial [Owenia fusiformis]